MSPSITEIIAQTEAHRKTVEGIVNGTFQLRHMETLEERVNKARAEFTKRVFKKHKIIEGLEEINRNYLSGIQKHEVRFFPEQKKAILIWGSKYSFDKDGEVEFNSDCSFIKVSLISSPPLEFKPDTLLCVLGEEVHYVYSNALAEIRVKDRLREEKLADYYDPSYNCEQIKEVLAKCYLSPGRHRPQVDSYKVSTSITLWEESNSPPKGKKEKSKQDDPPSYFSSSGSSNCECCCECQG